MENKDAKQSRIDYAHRKQNIIDLLDKSIEFYLSEQEMRNAEALKKLKADLQSGEFSIVVVGEFSAGKSTLLNALMGKRILPSWLNETTATVNFLRHKEKAKNGEAGMIFYQDGTSKEIPAANVETIEKYVSTKGDEVAGKISYVDIYLDSEFLKDGVTLVDSPGLNGVADGHREITEAQILKSHASIFLFSSDHPGTKTDFEFLHDLQKRVKTIIFVLNKIDDIRIEENETVEGIIDTLKKNYKKQFPEENEVPEIWPVSAREALYARDPQSFDKNATEEELKTQEQNSKLIDFENRLMHFLTSGEKAQQQMLAPVDRVISITKESKENYIKEIQAIQTVSDTGEVEENIAELQSAVGGLNAQIANSRSQILISVTNSMKDIEEGVKAKLVHQKENIQNNIDSIDDLNELEAYVSDFESRYQTKVRMIVTEAEELFRQKFTEIVQLQYAREAEEIDLRQSKSDISMDFCINTHLEIENEIYEVGLREMNEKIKIAEKKLQEAKVTAEAAKEDYLKCRSIQKEKRKIEGEIEHLEKAKITLLNQYIPPAERYTEEKIEKRPRGGLLGKCIDGLFGEKEIITHVLTIDSSDKDEVQSRVNKQLEDIEEKLKNKESKISSLENSDIELSENQCDKKYTEVEECRQLLDTLREKNMEFIDEQKKKIIRKIKYKLEDYSDTIANEFKKQIESQMKKIKDGYVSAIREVVEANLKKTLMEKQERLSQLKHQLSSSEENKNERIIQLNQKVEKLDTILDIASDLRSELKEMEIDQIGSVVLSSEV